MRFVAGRGAVAERLVRGAAVAERHRENVAGRSALAKLPKRRGKDADAPPHSGRAAAAEHHREEAAKQDAAAE